VLDNLKSAIKSDKLLTQVPEQKRNMEHSMVTMVERAISKEFQCSKCKMKRVSCAQAQTGAADKPLTTFCECQNCGNRWKYYLGP
jgi:transcription elongation factor S-II